MQTLPNLIYVGMGKAGSTLLHKLFQKHPEIHVSEVNKEINFFTDPANWSKGPSWYGEQFSGYQGQKWVADISPGYHNRLEAARRMKDVLGADLKILFTFRRFTDFAYSRYLHSIRANMKKGSFLELLEQKSMFFKPLDILVDEYIKLFGRENVLIMHYEKEFDRKSPGFETRIYDFLGLPKSDRYYDLNRDSGVNSGYVPRFVYAKGRPYREVRNGIEYIVPPDTLVYCCGRSFKNHFWNDDAQSKQQELMDIQESWTKKLDEETYRYVQKTYTEPLARRLEDKLNISFQHWCVNEPRCLEYPDAPLPDAYISDPELRSRRVLSSQTQTPWI